MWWWWGVDGGVCGCGGVVGVMQLTRTKLMSHSAAMAASSPNASAIESPLYPAAFADVISQPAALASAVVNPAVFMSAQLHPAVNKGVISNPAAFKYGRP